MNLSALVMAGGRGSRMAGEKAIARVGGISMLSRVVEALSNSKMIDRVIVSSSSSTPKTSDEAQKLGLEVVNTPGMGYVKDMNYAIRTLNLEHVLVINSDLPFINTELIDQVIDRYAKAEKPALTVMVPISKLTALGFEPTYTTKLGDETLAPVGLNVLDGKRIGDDEVAQEVVVMTDVLPFINVNNAADIERAEILLKSMPRLQQATT